MKIENIETPRLLIRGFTKVDALWAYKIWNDPEIGVGWPLEEGVDLIISEKDQKWKGLKDTFKF